MFDSLRSVIYVFIFLAYSTNADSLEKVEQMLTAPKR